MSQSLYQEAIAEAKQLREIAEQNAKNAIIEAITPKIRHFIENQLLETDLRDHQADDNADFLEEAVEDLMSDSAQVEEVKLNEEAISMLMNLVGPDENLSKLVSHVKGRTIVANALSESVDSLNDDDKEKLLKIAKDLKVTAENLNSNDIVIDANLDTQNFEEYTEMNETNETLYEVDLDEIAALLETELTDDLDELDLVVGADDLEALGLDAGAVEDLDLSALDVDVSLADDLLGDDVEGEDEEVELDLDVEDDVEGAEAEEGEGGEEEEALDEVFEIDPDMLREELASIALAEAKELAKVKGIKNDMSDSWGGKGHGNAGLKSAYGGGGSGSGDDFGGGKREGDPLSVKMNKLSENLNNERRRNRSLSNKLNEYRSAIGTLREQLTEMNLFNAKLLYVNKLLQNKHIAPSQRKSIIGALDDARSLREVKLLYKSLTESIQKPKGTGRLSESASRRTLGSSSRTVQSSSSTRAEDEVGRWAKLAGIK